MEHILRPDFVLRALNHHRVRYIIVGSYAAVLHGAIWTPSGVDIVVPRVTPQNDEYLADALRFLEATAVAAMHKLGIVKKASGAPGVAWFTTVGDGLTYEDLVLGARWITATDNQRGFVASQEHLIRTASAIGRFRDHLLVGAIESIGSPKRVRRS